MSFQTKTQVSTPRTRKRCYWCGEWCDIGQPRVVIAGKWEGDFFTSVYHPGCSAGRSEWWRLNKMEYEGPEEHSMQRGSHRPKEGWS